jgi:hypothetical protein
MVRAPSPSPMRSTTSESEMPSIGSTGGPLAVDGTVEKESEIGGFWNPSRCYSPQDVAGYRIDYSGRSRHGTQGRPRPKLRIIVPEGRCCVRPNHNYDNVPSRSSQLSTFLHATSQPHFLHVVELGRCRHTCTVTGSGRDVRY